jgi:hypothetical protein
MLRNLRKEFPVNGTFNLSPGENVTEQAKSNEVPNKPGIYLIYAGHGCTGSPIYIGKAGTLTQSGLFKPQGISERLGAKQDGKPRNIFFRELMQKRKYRGGLSFAWFVTYGQRKMVLPALAEANAMQSFFKKTFKKTSVCQF